MNECSEIDTLEAKAHKTGEDAKAAAEDSWEHLAAETENGWEARKFFCTCVQGSFHMIQPFTISRTTCGFVIHPQYDRKFNRGM